MAKRFNPKGLKKIEKNLSRELEGMEGVTMQGVWEWLEEVGKAADEITPIDTRALIDSQYIVVQEKGGVIIGEIGYDANNEADYAVFVHEIPKNYKTNNPKGQWKFLQTPLMQKRSELISKIQGKNK